MDLIKYRRTLLTGGTQASLDGIDGSALREGDMSFIYLRGNEQLLFFRLDATSGLSENSPYIIQPDNNPGSKRWILQSITTNNIDASSITTLDFVAENITTNTLDASSITTIYFECENYRNGSIRNISYYNSFESAIDTTNEITLVIDREVNVSIDSPNTVPENIHLVVTQNGLLTLSGNNLIINGPFTAPLNQCFKYTDGGIVTFGENSNSELYPEWWGESGLVLAVGSISTSNKTLIISSPITLTGDISIPKTMTLKFLHGGIITLGTFDLTFFNSPLAEKHQIFEKNSTGYTIWGTSTCSVFQPKWFGCVGDGVSDDTIPMQNMIDSAVNNDCVFDLSSGTWLIDGITITKKCRFQGETSSSMIKHKANSNNHLITININSGRVIFDGLWIHGNSANQINDLNGIHLPSTGSYNTAVEIRNCIIGYHSQYGVYAGIYRAIGKITNTEFKFCKTNVFLSQDASDWQILNNYIGDADTNIYMGSGATTLKGNYIFRAAEYGIFCATTAHYSWVEGNSIDSNQKHSLYIDDDEVVQHLKYKQHMVVDNAFTNNSLSGDGLYPEIFILGSKAVSIVGNSFYHQFAATKDPSYLVELYGSAGEIKWVGNTYNSLSYTIDVVNTWAPFSEISPTIELSAEPLDGTWRKGNEIKNSEPSVGNPMGWVCVESGTASDATCSGLSDGITNVITDATCSEIFTNGWYVHVDKGFPNSPGPYQIIDIDETTITLDINSNSAEYVEIWTEDAIFEKLADIGDPLLAEMYWDNANPTVIETANTPIMIRETTTGFVSTNWTYHNGTTGAITLFADGGGKVNVTSAGHNLVDGDIISIRGTTNYNGIFSITRIDPNIFSISSVWGADEAPADWDQGSYLKAGTNATGYYNTGITISVKDGGVGHEWHFQTLINTTPCPKCVSHVVLANNDLQCISLHSIAFISASDRLSLTVEEDNTNNITISHGDMSVHKL